MIHSFRANSFAAWTFRVATFRAGGAIVWPIGGYVCDVYTEPVLLVECSAQPALDVAAVMSEPLLAAAIDCQPVFELGRVDASPALLATVEVTAP